MNRRVIIVDDDPDFAESLSMVFESYDYAICSAHSIKETLEKCHAFEASFALVDMKLPDGSGCECIQKLKEMYPNMRPLLMTGFSLDVVEEDAQRCGVWKILRKPFDLEDLFKTIETEITKNKE